ncbi:MAG: hypothetical protein M9927_02760 [Anaerolineae bacterium]|nr:hypothetical protein [Anaerolineae bacterium]
MPRRRPRPRRSAPATWARPPKACWRRSPARSTGFYGDTTFYLDDGSGEARITVKQYTGFRRPYVNNGDIWTVTGIVSQNDDEAPYDSNYRILPRTPDDIYEGRPTGTTAATTRTSAADDSTSFAPGDAPWNYPPHLPAE